MTTKKMFETEIDLVKYFTQNCAKRFLDKVEGRANRRFVLLEEFDCYDGVADIVLAILRPYARLNKRRRTINHNWLLPLTQFAKGQIVELNEYAARFCVSTGTARKHLQQFARAGFLERLNEGCCRYRVSEVYTPVLESAISLEAKLHDWRRALAQAYRYRRFSTYSFVLLPAATSSGAVNNLELFRQHDVGLVTLGADGLSIHHRPTRRDRPINAAFLRANEAACKATAAD